MRRRRVLHNSVFVNTDCTERGAGSLDALRTAASVRSARGRGRPDALGNVCAGVRRRQSLRLPPPLLTRTSRPAKSASGFVRREQGVRSACSNAPRAPARSNPADDAGRAAGRVRDGCCAKRVCAPRPPRRCRCAAPPACAKSFNAARSRPRLFVIIISYASPPARWAAGAPQRQIEGRVLGEGAA